VAQVFLVRHAQASFFGPDYDELSALGHQQAQALGRYWAGAGFQVDRIYVGPRRRHCATCEVVLGEVRARGARWPDPEPLDLLDEHEGIKAVKRMLGHGDGPGILASAVAGSDREESRRRFFQAYARSLAEWAAGRVELPGIETWREFQLRAARALEVLCGGAGRSLAFTSGGLVSAALGALLGLDSERVIDLSLVLRNTAITELSQSGARRRLISFNAIPHLADPEAVTAV
jgi:broad specificity phosphatase PhoE